MKLWFPKNAQPIFNTLSLWPTTIQRQTYKCLQNENAIVFDSLFIKTQPIMHLRRHWISISNFCAIKWGCKQATNTSVLISIVRRLWFIESDLNWQPQRIPFAFFYFKIISDFNLTKISINESAKLPMAKQSIKSIERTWTWEIDLLWAFLIQIPQITNNLFDL